MYKLCLSLLVVFALPTVVSANGGNGGKNTGKIEIKNSNGSLILLVAVDPTDSLKDAENAAEFQERGGRIVDPGESTTFSNLKVGNHTVVFKKVPAGTEEVDPETFTSRSVNVKKGGKAKLSL